MKLSNVGLIILLVLSQPVSAEVTTGLDEYIVTARPIGLQSIEHIARPITVLRDEELAEKQSSTIGETLSNIPGVTTNRFSPLASRPIIRGLGGSRVLVLENGVNSLDVSTISPDHAVTVEPIQTEQIEIFRGPSTLLYGSGASGGLVNAVTNRIPEYIPENLKTKFYSSYNSNSLEKLLSFQTEGGFGNIAFHLDGTKRDARNYQSKKGQVDNSFYDAKNFNFGSSYVDDWGFLGISFGKVKSRYGVPFDPDNPNELPFIVTDQDRFDIAGTFNNPFNGIQAIHIQAGHNDYLHTEFEDAITAGTIFTNKQWDGRVEIQHSPIGKFNGTLGTQLGLRSLNAAGNEAYIPGTKSKTAAFFLLEETDFGSVHFEIGARYERQIDDPNNASKVINDMYSASTGLHWHVFEDIALGLTASRSQRAPAVEELFANGPHLATGTFEIGQSGLDIETANNIDISLVREEGIWQWNLSLFVNYIEDFIFLQGLDRDNDGAVDEVDETGTAPGEFTLVQYQQDNTVFYGFEAAMNIKLYSGTKGQLDFNVFGDYVRAERENGDNLPRISPARIGAGLDYSYHKFSARFDLTNTLAQNDNGALETDTGGYSALNIKANYNLHEGEQNLSIFLKGTNLMDEDGKLHTSFIKDRAPIMGRAVMIGFQARF